MSLVNCSKILNYKVDMLNITKNVWVVNPQETIFIDCDLEGLRDFEGAAIINLKDFMDKLSLFVKKPQNDEPFIDAQVRMSEDYVMLKNGSRKLKYPFSHHEIRNHLITDSASGESYPVSSIVQSKLKQFKEGDVRKFVIHLDADKYKELDKLAKMFKSVNNSFTLKSKDGKVMFYTEMDNGTSFETEVAEIPYDDFDDFCHTVTTIPHVDDWEVTIFEDKDVLHWSSQETHFNMLMIV